MRTILKIIAAPFVLALILAVAVLSFLSCIAGAFCWLACTAFVLLAVCGLFAGLKTGCIAMLVLAVSFIHTVFRGRYFMQAQVKYESEFKTAVLGDRTITVKNVTPIYPPQERDKRDREIERRLFDVFVKYAGRRG